MLENIKIPVLALYGSLDWIVSSNPSIEILSKALNKACNKSYKVIEMTNLNHSFQECQTGALAEYRTIEQTISPEVLTITSDWILKTIKA